MTSISNDAFAENASIKKVAIINDSNSFNVLCADAFSGCAIEDAYIDISSANGTCCIGGYGLQKCPALHKLSYGSNVSAIAPSAMVDTRGTLSSVSFTSSLTSIGDYAFAEVYDRFPRIKSMELSSCIKLESIGKYAFYNSILDASKHSLVFPSSLLSIEDAAFAYRNVSWT